MKAHISKANCVALSAGKWPDDVIADDEVRGFRAVRQPSGTISLAYRYRTQDGERRQIVIGLFGTITTDVARKQAQKYAGIVASGGDPQGAKQDKRAKDTGKNAMDAAWADFEKHHLPTIKSGNEYKRCYNVYVKPCLGSQDMFDLKRSQITDMLDKVAEENGAVQSDRVLAHMRKFFNWFATRNDDFNTPVVKGMARTKPGKRKRQRALDAQEIRDLWTALDECHDEGLVPPCFRACVKTLFLTATRLRMVTNMHRDELEGRTWTIPEKRNKVGIPFMVYLTDDVQAELKTRTTSPFVFSNDGGEKSFKGFSKAKAALDKKLDEIRKRDRRKPMAHWTFHDFRRTARGLMKKGGIDQDTCERVLGHVIAGVRGVYDVEDYFQDKTHALKVLASQVQRILDGKNAKVVEFKPRAA